MDTNHRISRIIEHWTLPTPAQVLEHVHRAQIQLVQVGNFGIDFYSLAEDDTIEVSWGGMPLKGVAPNLERAAEFIPQIQAAGAAVVGQLSTTMHFGNHEQKLGLFGPAWDQLWTPALLGPAPATDIGQLSQKHPDGSLKWRTIPGRPYRTYRGCMCNPQWLDVLKAMVRKGIELGLDGFNATHHYESFCHCQHCCTYARSYLDTHLSEAERHQLFGCSDMATIANPFAAQTDCPKALTARLELVLAQGAGRRRKESFDAVFTQYGRSLKPGLLLAQWNHKYDFRPHDERSLLPQELWAKGEDYIWYSQGPSKAVSSLAQGYLADMGLPSRFMYAAGNGRPFVINKYDYKRWRLWAAEAMAHHGTAVAFHAGPPRLEQEENSNIAPEDYYGPVIRYQRFMAAHEAFLHPAVPSSQIALVYPKRAELQAEMDCLDALKRLGHLLEDKHWLFDIILDVQLVERAADYAVIILPQVERLSNTEAAYLEHFVAAGGILIFTDKTGNLNLDGSPHTTALFQSWRQAPVTGSIGSLKPHKAGTSWYLPNGPWTPHNEKIQGLDTEMPIFPKLVDDPFGQQFLQELDRLVGTPQLLTDAPWFVRVRAWRPTTLEAVVIHWINYQQDESAVLEIPLPVGPLAARYQLPEGFQLERLEWHYPEMREPLELEYTINDGAVHFSIPRLIVYGMSILYLRPL